MADFVISHLLQRFATLLEDQIWYEVNLVRGVEKKVSGLADKLQTIRNLLDDAEKRGVKEPNVKKWLRKLQHLAYEMDDVLDEWHYALLKHNIKRRSSEQKVCGSFVSSPCLSFKKVVLHRSIAEKIQNVKDKLDQILKEKDEFGFVISAPATDSIPKHPRPQSVSTVDTEKIHGRDIDKNKDEIVRNLCLNGGSQILSIVGMGGIGKTTLTQLVYNDTRLEGCFDSRIWICVSHPFDVGVIARGIVYAVTKELIPSDPNIQLNDVLQRLKDSISGKKFLLVLDDVWTERYDEWEPLKINLVCGALGSKILVTTRNERVAGMMMGGNANGEIYRPQKLTDEECWKLLRHMSLLGKSKEECAEFDECEKFEEVGKKIAERCDGLPLAANLLGSVLRLKHSPEEWENILESEIWRLEEEKLDLFPHLLLSYNELSPALKCCFSYCSVYPKDCEIPIEELIEEWRAQGYLGRVIGNGGDTGSGGAESKGQDYINSLAMHSLLQVVKFGEKLRWCKMHDIVHDFAQFLRKNDDRVEVVGVTERSCQVCNPALLSQAQEYHSIVRGQGFPSSFCYCVESVRVLRLKIWDWGNAVDGLPSRMKKLIHLRLLDLSCNKLSKEVLNIICGLYFLQSLQLAQCSLEEIPSEIENLAELRHLNLSNNDRILELPDSICSLVELNVLNIDGCSSLSRLPEGVGRLTGLRTIGDTFGGGSGSCKLGMLKDLNSLSGSLVLEINCNSSDLGELVEDARRAELRNKIHIQTLVLIFDDRKMEKTDRSSSMWTDVIEALEPHQKLKKVEIYQYPGSRLPHWISSPHNFVKQIQIRVHLTSLPLLGKLPFLEFLNMHLWEGKVVGREFLGIESSSSSSTPNDIVVAFPKLKELKFEMLNEWTEWEDITAEEEESVAVSIMPSLTHFTILRCHKLKKLPHRLLRKVSSSLEFLNIVDSKELRKNYGEYGVGEDDGGTSFAIPCRNNPKLDIV